MGSIKWSGLQIYSDWLLSHQSHCRNSASQRQDPIVYLLVAESLVTSLLQHPEYLSVSVGWDALLKHKLISVFIEISRFIFNNMTLSSVLESKLHLCQQAELFVGFQRVQLDNNLMRCNLFLALDVSNGDKRFQLGHWLPCYLCMCVCVCTLRSCCCNRFLENPTTVLKFVITLHISVPYLPQHPTLTNFYPISILSITIFYLSFLMRYPYPQFFNLHITLQVILRVECLLTP